MSTRRPPSAPAAPSPASVPALFHVGGHVLRISKIVEGRWVVSVDDQEIAGGFSTQADAWEAGVREADRLDRQPNPAP